MNLDIKISCQMDRSISKHCLKMSNISLDELWICNEESMDDGHYRSQ